MRLSIHHIALLTKNIEKSARDYVKFFQYTIVSPIIHDPIQTAYVQFLQLEGSTSYIELIAPDGLDSKLTNALKKGGGLNHLCYSTSNIDKSCSDMVNQGLFLLQAPVAATAFPGRRIAWLMGRDGIPVELVEKGEDKWQLN